MSVLNRLVALFLGIILIGYLLTETVNQPDLSKSNDVPRYETSEVISNNEVSYKSNNEDSKDTLEQEMVDSMKNIPTINEQNLSPRYQPLIPNSAGASLVQ
jgi:hypothetical protein